MSSLKKIIALVLIMCLVFSFAACDSSDNTKKDKNAKWVDKLVAPGDVFEIPEVKSSGDKAPIIAELSKQVNPGTTFTVTGGGFTDDTKAYIYAQSKKGDGKLYESTCTVLEDTTLMITVPESVKYGIYGVYLQNKNGTSNLEFINRPKIWWNGLTGVSAGDEFNIYGENLTTENGNKTHAFIIDENGKNCELEVVYADPYKVTVKIPKGLEDGKEYTIKIHNGHGGELAFAEVPEKIRYSSSAVVKFDGEKLDVTDFGANPANNNKDDSAAVQKAVDAAADGDIIYFPEGVYRFDSQINVQKSLRFEGSGISKTKFVNGNFEGDMFSVKLGPTEFCKISFSDIRKTSFKAGFIHYIGDQVPSDIYNLYVHDCYFEQDTSPIRKSQQGCIKAEQAYGVIITKNKFEATQLCFSNGVEKIFITKNDYCGTFYVGPDYNQNMMIIWATSLFDASDNKIYGKDKLTDDSGALNRGDYTTGRAFAFQGASKNVYVSNNVIERVGMPADNGGEQILFENLSSEYFGEITDSTENSITLTESLAGVKDAIVTIVGGKGVGQWRYISKTKGKIITLSENWDIIPDSTSKVLVSLCYNNLAVHNNLIDGFTNHADTVSAGCGIQLYATTHNCFITNNVTKNMPYGICILSHFYTIEDGKDSANTQQGVYWTQIENNTASNVSVGLRFSLETKKRGSGEIPMQTCFGVVVKNNQFKDTTDFLHESKIGLGGTGILFGTVNYSYNNITEGGLWVGKWENGTLFENNVLKNNQYANIQLFKHQANTVLINNKIDDKWPLYTVMPNGVEPSVSR